MRQLNRSRRPLEKGRRVHGFKPEKIAGGSKHDPVRTEVLAVHAQGDITQAAVQIELLQATQDPNGMGF